MPRVFAAIAHRTLPSKSGAALKVIQPVLAQQRGCRPHQRLDMSNLSSRSFLWSSNRGHSAKKWRALAWDAWHHLQAVRTFVCSVLGRKKRLVGVHTAPERQIVRIFWSSGVKFFRN
eukprot:s718_g8.t1